jgi:hypothetical protein
LSHESFITKSKFVNKLKTKKIMKKQLFRLTLCMIALFSFSQSYAVIINVSGHITSNTTWSKTNVYVLNGFVYVDSLITLKILPGTKVKGDFASKGTLIVSRGAKLLAEGTPANPIVFTSNKAIGARAAGDWGGVVLCGAAPSNRPGNNFELEGGYGAWCGGTNPNDNSGILKYVRIEFAGIAFAPNQEINSLTLGAVGAGTLIDYVQVTRGLDDGFEWFGGTVNAKHLISYKSQDDDFDFDFGYTGKLQHIVATRGTNVSDISKSNGVELDNDGTGTGALPKTAPVITNMSLFGPLDKCYPADTTNLYKFGRGIHLRRNGAPKIFNSVVLGWPVSQLTLDGDSVFANAQSGLLQFEDNVVGVLAPCAFVSIKKEGTDNAPIFNQNQWYLDPAKDNETKNGLAAFQFKVTPFDQTTDPNYPLRAASTLNTGADFTHAALANPFFDVVAYKGAFSSGGTWAFPWTEFNPETKDYCETCLNRNGNDAAGVDEIGTLHMTLSPNVTSDFSVAEFYLEQTGKVSISVVDMNGAEVRQVANNEMAEGVHEVNINVAGLTSGMYVVKAVSGDKAQTSRIIVR